MTVAGAAEHATDEAGFFIRLRGSGVLVRERFSEVNPGEVTGCAVTLPGCTGPDGTPRWFGRRTPAQHADPDPVARELGTRLRGSGAFRRVPVHWTGTCRDLPSRGPASRHRGEHLRHCTASDPDHGADTAWAVADALHTAATATGSPALRGAADTYDRASRSPHGMIPGHTPEGNQLRAAARLLAISGGTTADGMGPAVALAGNLVALIDAVAGLRRAQAHTAQAIAARAAA